MNDEDTQDLLQFEQDTQRTEAHMRRCGRINRIAGISIFSTTYALTGAIAVASDVNFAANNEARLFHVLGLVVLTALSVTLYCAGAAERREQPIRAQLRRNHRQQDANTRQITEIQETLRTIAKHLPDTLDTAHWKGYNAAVKDGFTEKTGTEGPQRPRHIGLVRPNEGPQQKP